MVVAWSPNFITSSFLASLGDETEGVQDLKSKLKQWEFDKFFLEKKQENMCTGFIILIIGIAFLILCAASGSGMKGCFFIGGVLSSFGGLLFITGIVGGEGKQVHALATEVADIVLTNREQWQETLSKKGIDQRELTFLAKQAFEFRLGPPGTEHELIDLAKQK